MRLSLSSLVGSSDPDFGARVKHVRNGYVRKRYIDGESQKKMCFLQEKELADVQTSMGRVFYDLQDIEPTLRVILLLSFLKCSQIRRHSFDPDPYPPSLELLAMSSLVGSSDAAFAVRI